MIAPSFSLNFTSATLDPRVTFTRAGNTATRVNASGLIEGVAADTPRFDYDPVTLACKGLLIEELRTNLLLQSNDFNSANWSKGGSSFINNNFAISPDGTQNADRINFDVSELSRVQQGIIAASNTWVYSTWLKTASGSIDIRFGEAASLSNITVTSTWQRFFVTSTTSNPNFTIRNSAAGGAKTVLVYGAQVEAGTSPTSYIPTTTTALTRDADVATITGSNFTSFWNATQGGAQVQALPSTVSGIRPLVQFDDGTANEIIALRGNTTNPEMYIVDGGTPQAQLDAGTIAANTAYSLTGWWATNDCRARKDSGAAVTDATATIPTVTQARIGSDGTNYLNGTIATINYYAAFSSQIYTRRKNKVFSSLL